MRTPATTANRYRSWGRTPDRPHAAVERIFWRSAPPRLDAFGVPVLPFGRGRSYGDSCLNGSGVLLDTEQLDRFIDFDVENGILRCEAGVLLRDVLEVITPRGWFLPIVPGTEHVSIGGAIANDIHGKNHHRAGSFGHHVRSFELLRSDGSRHVCSRDSSGKLFSATISGLGLTGVILWAELDLKRVPGPLIAVEQVPFGSLHDFFELTAESDASHEYTVAWIDALARGRRFGRGVFFRGNHADELGAGGGFARRPRRFKVVFDCPRWVLSRPTVKAFNAVYRLAHRWRRHRLLPYNAFFFPLDRVRHWNRIYGKRGFLQHQCVVPPEGADSVISEILEIVSRSGRASFLAVLKVFGSMEPAGLLSFPRPGVTLALDFPNRGATTLELLEQLDRVVIGVGGAVYPAKDARMSGHAFRSFFPRWQEFAEVVDPCFSSSFWRRVTARV